MIRPPPRSTRTAIRFPDTTPFRSHSGREVPARASDRGPRDAGQGIVGQAIEFLHLDRRDVALDLARDLVGVSRAEAGAAGVPRSEEHTSELQSLMRISYAVFCLEKKTKRSPAVTNPHIAL